MTSRERVLSCLARTGYDRIPVKHEGVAEVNQALMQHFGLSNTEQLLVVLGDDFRYVAPIYQGPPLRTFPDGSFEGYWGEHFGYVQSGAGKCLDSIYHPFADVESLDRLDRGHFPQADWFDYSTIRAQCRALRRFAVCAGSPGDLDFINGIARARGMEQVMIDLATDDEVYLAILEARFQFYYQMHERMLESAGGLIDIMHVGEDLGNQRGPMIGMNVFDRHFAPKLKVYFDMVHRHGARTMMHMCGCCEAFLPRLIALGLDIYDVVQPTAPQMDVSYLKDHHGAKLNFCGTMCVQTTLPQGATEDVRREVERRLALFPDGGLILGPTHAIQAGTPIENIVALYQAAGSLCERPDDAAILSVAGERGAPDRGDLFKPY